MFVAFSEFRFSTVQTSQSSPWRAVLATFGTKKLAVEFFATNAPNPPRLTKNSCLLRFRSFGFRRKNGAKLSRRSVIATLSKKNLAVEFFATNAPNPPCLTQNSCLLRFWSFGFRRKTVRNIPGRCIIGTFGTIKLAVEFSATNAPNPPCLTQNSCLLRFQSFGFRRKNGAKLAQEVPCSDFWNKKTCS